MRSLRNTFWLTIKELRSLRHDKMLLALLVFALTFSVYSQATGISSEVHNASLGIVDEDHTTLSRSIANAFYPPYFKEPILISSDQVDADMNAGKLMFVINIPRGFEEDVLASRHPELQVNIDATAVMQASIGGSYIQNIVNDEVNRFVSRRDESVEMSVNLVRRKAFNPNGDTTWFASITAIIDQVTLLTIVLTGAALIREREHGTIEHLLVMPLTSFDIAVSKVCANGLVILLAVMLSLALVVETILGVPVEGSRWLLLAGIAIYLFFATAAGIFLGTLSGSMAQFALLVLLTVLPLQMLSGAITPVESQPAWLQPITYFFPSRHFVSFSQSIIFRGAGISDVWRQFAVTAALGLACFLASLGLFRRSIAVSK
ncbi:ABC transporter permease [Rhodopirellula sallentina]|uniref:ABC transporter, permease protein n=1 Tax=Rhodopirellula sallentina SM41 TaxID=1263870 RepID=M5TZE3_9BACT|nr:ABC transporter permease [Rhodopirellula sallentina]EMI54399.1 ABC transporter, permease protein [Rhodopirellula sallentina SM41]